MRKLPTLFSMGKFKFGMAAAVLAVSGFAMAPLANANPIMFYDDATTSTTLRFTLTCDTSTSTGDCSQLKALYTESPVAWSSSTGDMFSMSNSGHEADYVNNLLGTSFSTGTQISGGGLDNTTFSTDADYFLIKIGHDPDYALLYNGSGGTLDFDFADTAGTGSGLSHYTVFGGTPAAGGGGGELPEPSSLGMLGLGLLFIGGLAIRARREHDRKAE